MKYLNMRFENILDEGKDLPSYKKEKTVEKKMKNRWCWTL